MQRLIEEARPQEHRPAQGRVVGIEVRDREIHDPSPRAVERPLQGLGGDHRTPADDIRTAAPMAIHVRGQKMRGGELIAVHEDDELAASLADRQIAGGRNPVADRLPEGADLAPRRAGRRVEDRGSLIGRAVVHDDDLVRCGSQGLRRERAQALCQDPRPIPRGGDNGNLDRHGAGAGARSASSMSWARTNRL